MADLLTVGNLKKHLAEMVDALEFYSNEATYKSPSSGFELQYDKRPAPIEADRGEKAKAALASARAWVGL